MPYRDLQSTRPSPGIPIGFGVRTNIWGVLVLGFLGWLLFSAARDGRWEGLAVTVGGLLVLFGLPVYWSWRAQQGHYVFAHPDVAAVKVVEALDAGHERLGLTDVQAQMVRYYATNVNPDSGWPRAQFDDHAAHLASGDILNWHWVNEGADERATAIEQLREQGWLKSAVRNQGPTERALLTLNGRYALKRIRAASAGQD